MNYPHQKAYHHFLVCLACVTKAVLGLFVTRPHACLFLWCLITFSGALSTLLNQIKGAKVFHLKCSYWKMECFSKGKDKSGNKFNFWAPDAMLCQLFAKLGLTGFWMRPKTVIIGRLSFPEGAEAEITRKIKWKMRNEDKGRRALHNKMQTRLPSLTRKMLHVILHTFERSRTGSTEIVYRTQDITSLQPFLSNSHVLWLFCCLRHLRNGLSQVFIFGNFVFVLNCLLIKKIKLTVSIVIIHRKSKPHRKFPSFLIKELKIKITLCSFLIRKFADTEGSFFLPSFQWRAAYEWVCPNWLTYPFWKNLKLCDFSQYRE